MADTSPTLPLPREISYSRIAADALPAQLRVRVRTRIAELVFRGSQALGLPVLMPECSFDLRGRAAGQAAYECLGNRMLRAAIRLNPKLLLTNEQEMFADTLPHEVAHLLTVQRYGPKVEPHGTHWQRVVRVLGAVPRTTHSMEIAAARVVEARYVYRCGCKEHKLTILRHKKVKNEGAKYRCNHCRQTLRFERELPPAASLSAARKSAPPTSAPPAPPAAGGPSLMPGLPTERQLAYATDLARRRGTAVPQEALGNRQVLSHWIAQQLSPR